MAKGELKHTATAEEKQWKAQAKVETHAVKKQEASAHVSPAPVQKQAAPAPKLEAAKAQTSHPVAKAQVKQENAHHTTSAAKQPAVAHPPAPAQMAKTSGKKVETHEAKKAPAKAEVKQIHQQAATTHPAAAA